MYKLKLFYNMYTQNNEEQIIMNYFNGNKGQLLDIGANDGITLSNSRAMVEEGWKALLLEPSPKAYARLEENCKGFVNVVPYNFGISNKSGTVEFWESGAFNHSGPDVALLSCIDPKEKERWGTTVSFEAIQARMLTFADFITGLKDRGQPIDFHFISIDAEGMDWEILKQIDLRAHNCQCFCIEHNSVADMIDKCRSYAQFYSMKEIGFNPENLIFAR